MGLEVTLNVEIEREKNHVLISLSRKRKQSYVVMIEQKTKIISEKEKMKSMFLIKMHSIYRRGSYFILSYFYQKKKKKVRLFLRELKAQSEGLENKKGPPTKELMVRTKPKVVHLNGLFSFISPREFQPYSRSNVLELTCPFFSTSFTASTHYTVPNQKKKKKTLNFIFILHTF